MEVDVATTVQLRVQRIYSASYNGSFAIFISSSPHLLSPFCRSFLATQANPTVYLRERGVTNVTRRTPPRSMWGDRGNNCRDYPSRSAELIVALKGKSGDRFWIISKCGIFRHIYSLWTRHKAVYTCLVGNLQNRQCQDYCELGYPGLFSLYFLIKGSKQAIYCDV